MACVRACSASMHAWRAGATSRPASSRRRQLTAGVGASFQPRSCRRRRSSWPGRIDHIPVHIISHLARKRRKRRRETMHVSMRTGTADLSVVLQPRISIGHTYLVAVRLYIWLFFSCVRTVLVMNLVRTGLKLIPLGFIISSSTYSLLSHLTNSYWYCHFSLLKLTVMRSR